MDKFAEAYRELNNEQKTAVDTIDGPVLVVAGPGTGKTQLLALRVANIIKQTDTAPGNILCLTFTDNAARNMRERLENVIGQTAYHVAIHTFHSFGGEVISQYGDYFTKRQLLQQIDELGRYELLRGIFEKLPHSNPLSVRVGGEFIYIRDTLEVISWLKQNALTPSELHQLATANQKIIDEVADELATAFQSTPSPKQLPAYGKLLRVVEDQAGNISRFGFPDYARVCADELAAAIATTHVNGRYAPAITVWRNSWAQKDAGGRHVFKDGGKNLRKMHAVANVYEALFELMSEQGLYDFDDMIMEVVHALELSDELRLNLQERYQYVLVDEFQDTNKAQLRMLTALGDNPLNEGRPNIMAVGDDDQAIYAFQGADVSNMAAFPKLYRDPAIVTLKCNYRSTPQILAAAFSVAGQITDRLEVALPDTHKALTAHKKPQPASVAHMQFSSELSQYDYLAEQIQQAIRLGTRPEAIAVIAPRHRYLERLMPYLGSRRLPVAYERREDILSAPIIVQLLTMSRLLSAIHDGRQDDIDQLLSEVLSYPFWQLSSDDLVRLSLDCYSQHKHWLELALEHRRPAIRKTATWFVELSARSTTEPLEYMLDHLLGGLLDGFDNEFDDLGLELTQTEGFVSPMREYYFSKKRFDNATDSYLTLLGQLSTLRRHLREWLPHQTLYIRDFVIFADLHRQASMQIIDTNPHTQSTNAVQVMTAYKAKGLEFDTVFLINAQDEIWGPTARSRNSRLTLPKNLPIAPAGDNNNDKLRLLFVALTRAKNRLCITSYTQNLDNKLSPALSFLGQDKLFEPTAIKKPTTSHSAEILSTDWAYRYRQVIADKPILFEPILADYKLSVTHLNNFIDIVNAGPQYFLVHSLLRFPEAQAPAAAFGDAVHKTLQWAQMELRASGNLPKTAQLTTYFSDALARKHLRKSDQRKLDERGKAALKLYFTKRGKGMSAQDSVERGFNNEGVIVAGARLSGKIDKLHYEDDTGAVTVIDFKTGKPAMSWQGRDEFEKVKLHKYRQQLLFYKLLVENAASLKGRLHVSGGALEFIEANDQGKLVDNLILTFDSEELERFSRLIGAIWQRISTLNFPDTRGYSANLAGIRQFEQDLIDGKISTTPS